MQKCEEQSKDFFIQLGIGLSDIKQIRKINIQLSMSLKTDFNEMLKLTLAEWVDTIREVSEVVSERKRIQTDGQNRRRNR